MNQISLRMSAVWCCSALQSGLRIVQEASDKLYALASYSMEAHDVYIYMRQIHLGRKSQRSAHFVLLCLTLSLICNVQEEYMRCTLPAYYRTVEEYRLPFDSEKSQVKHRGLKLLSVGVEEISFFDLYRKQQRYCALY